MEQKKTPRRTFEQTHRFSIRPSTRGKALRTFAGAFVTREHEATCSVQVPCVANRYFTIARFSTNFSARGEIPSATDRKAASRASQSSAVVFQPALKRNTRAASVAE